MTGETSHLYHAGSTSALLLFSWSGLEYSAEPVAFATIWNNVAQINRDGQRSILWLYQTPQQLQLKLSSSQTWFSAITRSIPLDQFGYPDNQALWHDLWNFAPQLRRSMVLPPDSHD